MKIKKFPHENLRQHGLPHPGIIHTSDDRGADNKDIMLMRPVSGPRASGSQGLDAASERPCLVFGPSRPAALRAHLHTRRAFRASSARSRQWQTGSRRLDDIHFQ